MEGILVIVLWCVVILTSIAGYLIWDKIKVLKSEEGMKETNRQIVNRYGYLRLITLFVLIGLFVIAVVSLLEATKSANYFKF